MKASDLVSQFIETSNLDTQDKERMKKAVTELFVACNKKVKELIEKRGADNEYAQYRIVLEVNDLWNDVAKKLRKKFHQEVIRKDAFKSKIDSQLNLS